MPGKAEIDSGVLDQMIKWLGLDGEESSKFKSEMMKRRGHKMVPAWMDGDGTNQTSENDNVFGINLGGNKDKNNGPGWQYGS
jgi:hypothetical protein